MLRLTWPLLLLLVTCSSASTVPYHVESDRVVFSTPSGILVVRPCTDRIIEVYAAPRNRKVFRASLAVIRGFPAKKFGFSSNAFEAKVSVADAQVFVNFKTGHVRLCDGTGRQLLSEADQPRTFESTVVGGESALHVTERFKLPRDQAFFGLGCLQQNFLDFTGHTADLKRDNEIEVNPMMVSTGGYGILWDNASETMVSFGDKHQPRVGPTGSPSSLAVKGQTLSYWSDVADRIHYYFIAGPEPDQVIRGYRLLTGSAPMFGRWAFGLWQSKERYKTQDEVLGVVRGYRSRGLPLDNVVQDWMYWPDKWGSHQFDTKRYPNPAAMVRTLHDDLHAHLMVSVWAKFAPGTDNYSELDRRGLLFPDEHDWSPGARYYDAFSHEGRAVYWRQIRDRLFDLGVDAWWLDATEPEIPPARQREIKTALGPGGWNLNSYSLASTGAVYQGQRQESDLKRVFILTRSSFSGQQRNGAASWSGDVAGTWDAFRRQIASGLNFCLAGIPYWGTDIGGFFSSKASDSAYRELFVRWFEWGSFCPIFRIHGTGADKEIWRFGADAERILARYDDLRYRLLPYTYSLSSQVTREGYTMMRALPMDYRLDPKTWGIADQLMFGSSIMVSPVDGPGAMSRTIYFPKGAEWMDFWTGERIRGGQRLVRPASLPTLPIAVRAGSIIPMGPVVQYASRQPNAPIELRIYPGADASFTLYDDEGDGYDYENGACSRIGIRWADTTRTLSFTERRGSYPGMPAKRQFRVVVVRPLHGTGVGTVLRPDRVITYNGSAVSFRFARASRRS